MPTSRRRPVRALLAEGTRTEAAAAHPAPNKQDR
jgi:hypothetical protein